MCTGIILNIMNDAMVSLRQNMTVDANTSIMDDPLARPPVISDVSDFALSLSILFLLGINGH